MLCLSCNKYFVFLGPPERCPKCGGILGEKKELGKIKIVKIWVR
jgi:rRNA maturation endonuclease Nob1